MRVEQIVTPSGAIRYLLLDTQGVPIEPVLRYLKFLDRGTTARNTLRTYCYHLRLFFGFLEECGFDYRTVGVDDMARFVQWLQYPRQSQTHDTEDQLARVWARHPARKPRTVNAVVTSALRFYTYLMIHEDYSLQLSERLKQQLAGSTRPFKGFLYHLSKDRPFTVSRLRLRVPKGRPKALRKETVVALVEACHNLRDALLIRLLWESGLRIGEALALWLEDVEIDARRIHVCDRGELANDAEIKTLCSVRTIDVSLDLIDAYLEYIAEAHTLDVTTNHIFLKRAGPARNHPMEYADVAALFRRLRRATGIHVTPHMLRHSSLTALRRAGWREEHIMQRAGHAHVQTTIQLYMHPDEADLRAEWERAEARLRLPRSGGH